MLRVRDDFRRAQIAIAALFCALGFQYATWAARLPALKSRLDLSEAELGLLLMACGVGAAVSFPLVAVLTRRWGSRRLAFVSTVFLGLLLLALAVAPNYPVALLIMCADGVGVGCLNVAMNAQGAALESRYGRTAMAKLHATFSGGSLGAALLASGTSALTSSVAAHFGAAAILVLLLAMFAHPALLTEDQQADAPREKKRRGFVLPAAVTLWMGLAMVFGTVAEGSMNDWSALYMKDVADASSRVAPLGIAVVSVMMVLARLFADGWRTRWGDGRVVRAGSVLAAAGLAFALLLGGVAPALIGFACMGLGLAAVTPCVYVAAARQGSQALALVAAMGTTGLLAGPPVIGFIASGSSLVWGMAAVAVSALLVSCCALRIDWTPVERAADGLAEPAGQAAVGTTVDDQATTTA
ncbi:MFS transporter [Streptomyces spectabilis]|uniref:MFS family permease n=1 Tax=Streptomyces spectabilis TaxID=68270 RepID=A0A5P2XNH8_STRST|nr:MFS transporter [Streptomyces spectabilis]MBB5105500.1 MFS family permease [Streptomyces spectabilis]MCI3906686.1 MFS transporter [Streptomyces spectabilis]QEV65134.1 MFS transporter [Streptomyces spectabilis]